MTEELSGQDVIQRNFYKEFIFGGQQTENEYLEERDRFASLLFEECQVEQEGAHDMFDTRKTLMSLEIKYAGGRVLTREDFLLAISLARKLLHHEDIEGVIPFIVRNRKKHPDFSAIQHHPRNYLIEIIEQRFIDTEEMSLHEDIGTDEEAAQDVGAILSFCLTVHKWNTKYYSEHPSVGVLFSQENSEEKRYRVGEQANYLAWWRGLPYEICQMLIEFGLLDKLDENIRSRYLWELCAMAIEELFDTSYFQHYQKPPGVPRILEYPPRRQPAEQLLRMLVGVCGDQPAMENIKNLALSNNFPAIHFTDAQQEVVRKIFISSEE